MTFEWGDRVAPSLEDIEEIAEAAFAALPEAVRAQTGRVVIRVADWADDQVLQELGIEDPLELTGLYDGIALTEKSQDDVAPMPDAVWLYRRAILDEWAERGGVTLSALVSHILVHEIAHHFGWSDEDIAAVDDWRL